MFIKSNKSKNNKEAINNKLIKHATRDKSRNPHIKVYFAMLSLKKKNTVNANKKLYLYLLFFIISCRFFLFFAVQNVIKEGKS